MNTRIHYYRIHANTPALQEKYDALVERIKAQGGGGWMHCLADNAYTGPDGGAHVITLDKKRVFDNQWNSSHGRVFDWYEGAYFDNRGTQLKHIHVGHWLEITDEMKAVRSETMVCGYCAAHYGPHYPTHLKMQGAFCYVCLASPYLEEKNLPSLRLMPASFDGPRPALNAREMDSLKSAWIKAQSEATPTDKKRFLILRDCFKALENARIERDGYLWLMERGLNIDNVIYYDHKGRFCYGWRDEKPAAEVVRKFKEVAADFPFPLDYK